MLNNYTQYRVATGMGHRQDNIGHYDSYPHIFKIDELMGGKIQWIYIMACSTEMQK